MDRWLTKGDVFVSNKLGTMLYGKIIHSENNNEPFVDFQNLHTEDYACPTTVLWTETKEGGWSRKRETKLDTHLNDPNFENAQWAVTSTQMTGGGTAMGPNDVFPDGHFVTAVRLNGAETVCFYQSGCFRGMIDPTDITLIK